MISYIAGKKGFGKTQFVRRKIIPSKKRVIVLDSLGFEYPYLTTETIFDFSETLAKNFKNDFFRITYNPFDDHQKEFFQMSLHFFDVLLIIEEADLYCSPSSIDESLDRLIRYGRHRKIDLCFVSRRPAEVHRNVTAQADEIISFRQTEPRDLEYFKKLTDHWEDLKTLKKWLYGTQMIEDIHFKTVISPAEK